MAFPQATWWLNMRRVNPSGPLVQAGLIDDSELSRSGAGSYATSSGSSGGWQVVDRPRRKASTEWLDYSPYTLTFSFILDGGEGVHPNLVEDAIAEMETWELPAPGGIEPPKIAILGPVPHNDLFWVVASLRWKEAIRDTITGGRSQQIGEISLLEYSPPSVTLQANASPAAAAQQRQAAAAPGSSTPAVGAAPPAPKPPAASGRTYTVRSGDTLSGIAASQLGNVALWTQIASLNGIRDPRSIQPGQVLKLPAAGPGTPNAPGGGAGTVGPAKPF